MNILIRLPNWLGDLVMSSAFIDSVSKQYPNSTIDVMVKKELSPLITFFPNVEKVYELKQNKKFSFLSFIKNLEVTHKTKYDLFFCLPNSFSSALIGFFTNSKKRIGYKNELRNIFLTHSYARPKGKHRLEEYLFLLENFCNTKIVEAKIGLKHFQSSAKISPSGKNIIFNINSAAQSRRIPISKSIEIVKAIRQKFDYNILLIGNSNESDYTKQLEAGLKGEKNIYNYSGKTNFNQLVQLIEESELVISTDSGIAHLANGLGKKVIVFFGAGNELNTGPFNKENLKIIRAENIECAPCVSNNCKLGLPICLTEIKLVDIISSIVELM